MATLNMIFNNVQIGPSLKSYEEIIAMSADNAVAELNTYPSDYYDKFNSEGHIYNDSGALYLGTSNSKYINGDYNIAYINGGWIKNNANALL